MVRIELHISCVKSNRFTNCAQCLPCLKIKIFFFLGRRHSEAQNGSSLPLLILDSTTTLHDPDQDSTRRLRLWLALVQAVREVLPRWPHLELLRRLRYGCSRLPEVLNFGSKRAFADLQQNVDAAIQNANSCGWLDRPGFGDESIVSPAI